ncbi:MAG: hypothetical protein IJJ85_06710 [Clostridia bacterium]|nr:hypothetical protein [Clostridia bacterium]
MKKYPKIAVVLICALLTAALLAPTSFAIGGGLLGNLEEMLGGNSLQDIISGLFGDNADGQINIDSILSNSELLKQLRSILGIGDNVSDSRLMDTIRDILGNSTFNISDLFSADTLQKIQQSLLGGGDTSTTSPANSSQTPGGSTYTPSYTLPASDTLTLPNIDIPTLPPSTTADANAATTPMPTADNTVPTLPSVAATENYTVPNYTDPYATPYDGYNYEETTYAAQVQQKTSSGKLALGIFILLLSAGAVVAVVVILKKNKI